MQGTGHKFDAISDFDELRVAIRTVEQDHKLKKASRPVKMTTAQMSAVELNTEIKELKSMASLLASTVKSLEKDVNSIGQMKTRVESPMKDFDTEEGPLLWVPRARPL